MRVSVIGTGYVGLVSGTCLAEIGHKVTCIDVDKKKIEMLKEGRSPIFEPGLTDLLISNANSQRLLFSNNFESVAESDVIFLAVGTPSSDNGQANLEYLKSAIISVAKEISDDAIIVIKSTVPVGTSVKMVEIIKEHTNKNFFMINNPEFLKEGSAVEDFMRPDRVIIGYKEPQAIDVMRELYAPLLRQGNPLFAMSNFSAEMTKYASNCFLALKISFINEIANLCDATGADIEEVRKGISSDRRIGRHFLYPGPGFGGSCFPKDLDALIYTAGLQNMGLKTVQAAKDVNDAQKTVMFKKIKNYFNGDIKGKKFAFWGVAFKANTDDVREAPSLYMYKVLIAEGATVNIYDPIASDNFINSLAQDNPLLVNSVQKFDNKYDSLKDCDGLVTMTEWREFRVPEFPIMFKNLKTKVIFDCRNLYDTKKVLKEGFDYFAIGKHISKENVRHRD